MTKKKKKKNTDRKVIGHTGIFLKRLGADIEYSAAMSSHIPFRRDDNHFVERNAERGSSGKSGEHLSLEDSF